MQSDGRHPGATSGAPRSTSRTVAILGQPVAHSLSPTMHNAAFAALGLDWSYVAFDVAPDALAAALDGVRALGLIGLNITAPHKAAGAAHVDRCHGEASSVGMVNTVVRERETLHGHSTDGEGFVRSLADHGVTTLGTAHVVILGAGGATVSIAWALAAAGARVTLINRSAARLERALQTFRGGAFSDQVAGVLAAEPAARTAIASATLVVNAVPPSAGAPDLDWSALSPEVLACDLSYAPAVTPFMDAVAACGLEHSWNGLGMLVHQGALSFRLWTGREAPIDVMAAAVGYRRPTDRS